MLGMSVKKTWKIVTILIAGIMVTLVTLYLSIDRIAILSLSRAYNLDISYARLKRFSPTGFSFTSLTCVDKKRKAGISSGSADIKADFRDMTVDFILRDVHFIKGSAQDTPSYDSLTSLVAAPFKSNWQYLQMSGSVRPLMDGLEVKSFTASSDSMKLTLKGSVHANGIIKSDIVIYFSPGLSRDIPQELSSTLLRDEPDGWKSLSVNLSGDYKKPAVEVTGKLFRLSVKEVSTAEK